ncbi:BH3 interacting domain death agonist isoform 2-T4 [Pholidichthys leucotaenia]
MDDLRDLTCGKNAALVIFAFLQADCQSSDFNTALLSLGKEFNLTRDINCDEKTTDSQDRDVECDGYLPTSITGSLADLQPLVDLQWPRDRAEAADIQEVARELREIAQHFEENIVNQATRNLRRNLSNSTSDFKDHLAREVERVMREGVGLEHSPEERVFMALTLTLVKGVCTHAPGLLRSLFTSALECITSVWTS